MFSTKTATLLKAYSDIDKFKMYLRASYNALDILEKSPLSEGDVVLLKETKDKGIILGFSIGHTPDGRDLSFDVRVHIITAKGTLSCPIEVLVPYSDAAKILYDKKPVQPTNDTIVHWGSNDEIPF